ncbi:hypothetical protein [Bacteroides sp.]|uniref:hypothetical protein n=1 Tax=Bacteroides sp. TaxID=29523 RepID=UPI002FCC8CBD|nr:hypothetical protein [Bacteroides sp.]
MKHVNFLMVALMIIMGTTVTSCMNGSNESSYDGVAIVTVEESIYGGILVTTDDGFRLIPTNPEVLKTSATEYVKRAQIAIKWAEGVVFDGDKEKTYKMSIVQAYGVANKKYCDQVDTLKNSYPIVELGKYVSGANGRYLNVPFTFNYNSTKEAVAFDLYPVKADGNELVMKLCQSVGSKDGYSSQTHMVSFELPTVSVINELLNRYQGQHGVEGGVLERPANDSIMVKIIADGRNDQKLTTELVKIRIRN